MKEGKWIEYVEAEGVVLEDTSICPCPWLLYLLKVYKHGKPYGVVRLYYETGKLLKETPFKNGKANGVGKRYFENGKLQSRLTYLNDSLVKAKYYDENGNEIK